MVKKATKTETVETPKDPKFAQKLEDNARKKFGRSYRFLNKDQKKEVNAETKFEPKLPEQTNNPPMGEQTQSPAQNFKTEPRKESVPFVDYITQFRCAQGHRTNGKVTAPVTACRVCSSPVEKAGHYDNDIFVPVTK